MPTPAIRVIMPTDQLWDSFFDPHSVTADFMNERNQPDMQKREDF
ncbi:hypothetical protein [Thalassospira alkalitolerans]